ncbi:MAG: DUF5985 family protein [Verrucomicrobia subdivision 3 bacterium]|nr:DUF5985 family protein [Limisphaerales bacterium]
MGEAVYILCGLTSALCAILLFRNYRASRVPLVLWTGICFLALTATNILLFVDLVLFPSLDMSTLRVALSLAGVGALLYELIRSTA